MITEGQFDDIVDLGRAASWTLDFRQLEAGPLEASLLLFGHPELVVARFAFNRAYHQLGTPPAGALTFGLPDPEVGPLVWNGAQTPPDVLINFSHQKELDAVNPPGGSGGFVLSFNPALLEGVRSDMGLPAGLLERVNERRFFVPSGALRPLLLDMVNSVRSEGAQGLSRWTSIFNHDLPALILTTLAGPELKPRMIQPQFRARALDRAVNLLASHDQMPGNIETLCHVAGASWATLLRAFKDAFGMSPNRYMKVRRLTAVREALRDGDANQRISDVANRWGFWHMGGFAADYRRQFGELPSETRARKKAVDISSRG